MSNVNYYLGKQHLGFCQQEKWSCYFVAQHKKGSLHFDWLIRFIRYSVVLGVTASKVLTNSTTLTISHVSFQCVSCVADNLWLFFFFLISVSRLMSEMPQ